MGREFRLDALFKKHKIPRVYFLRICGGAMYIYLRLGEAPKNAFLIICVFKKHKIPSATGGEFSILRCLYICVGAGVKSNWEFGIWGCL